MPEESKPAEEAAETAEVEAPAEAAAKPEAAEAAPKGVPVERYAAAERAREAAEKQLAQMQERLKSLEDAAAKADAERKKAAEKQKVQSGDLLGLVDDLRAERDTLRADLKAAREELEGLQSAEAARVEALKAENAARLAKLPEDVRDLIDPNHLPPDVVAAKLSRAEAIAAKATERPAGGRGGPSNPAAATPKPEDKFPPALIQEAKRLGADPEVLAGTSWGKRFLTTH